MQTTLILLLLALFGASIGSFVNVLNWRMPRGESIVYPRSHCTNCNHFLSWHENIPLISWFLLKGRCKACNQKIRFGYLVNEIICSIIFISCYFAQPTNLGSNNDLNVIIMSCTLSSILFSLTILDINHLWLPESICRIGIGLGISFAFITSLNTNVSYFIIIEHACSAMAGFLIFRTISTIAKYILGKPALGFGDAKLSALIGSFLGFSGLFIALYLAFITSALFVISGMTIKKIKMGQYIPFAPFLSVGCFLVLLCGNNFWVTKITAFSSIFA